MPDDIGTRTWESPDGQWHHKVWWSRRPNEDAYDLFVVRYDLKNKLCWAWDGVDSWDGYQDYARIKPAMTLTGAVAHTFCGGMKTDMIKLLGDLLNEAFVK